MPTLFALLALCPGNSPVPNEFPAQRPVTRSFDDLICALINGWVNNRQAGDLRRHPAHYDVIVMFTVNKSFNEKWIWLKWDQIFVDLIKIFNSLLRLCLLKKNGRVWFERWRHFRPWARGFPPPPPPPHQQIESINPELSFDTKIVWLGWLFVLKFCQETCKEQP